MPHAYPELTLQTQNIESYDYLSKEQQNSMMRKRSFRKHNNSLIFPDGGHNHSSAHNHHHHNNNNKTMFVNKNGRLQHHKDAYIGFEIERHRKPSTCSRSETESFTTDDEHDLHDLELPSPCLPEGLDSGRFSHYTSSHSTVISPLDSMDHHGSTPIKTLDTPVSRPGGQPHLVRSHSVPKHCGQDSLISPNVGFADGLEIESLHSLSHSRSHTSLGNHNRLTPSNEPISRPTLRPCFSFSDQDIQRERPMSSAVSVLTPGSTRISQQSPVSPATPQCWRYASPSERSLRISQQQRSPGLTHDAPLNPANNSSTRPFALVGSPAHPTKIEGFRLRRRRGYSSSNEIARPEQPSPSAGGRESSETLRSSSSYRRKLTLADPCSEANLQLQQQQQRQTKASFRASNIKVGFELGRGSFGAVYGAIDTQTGVQYAVKRLQGDGNDNKKLAFMDEVHVMESLSHPNIVQYYGSSYDHETCQLDIYLEFVAGGSIASQVRAFGALPETLVRSYTAHMVRGIRYLHSRNIIHRDIKGANVLVTTAGVCKLADFGCSKLLLDMNETDREETLQRIRGSVPWMAPEVVQETQYHFPADIWSLGATVLEMASGQRPWPNVREQLPAIFKIGQTKEGPPIPDHVPPSVCEFLRPLFAINPSDRPSAAELDDHHPFLA